MCGVVCEDRGEIEVVIVAVQVFTQQKRPLICSVSVLGNASTRLTR